MDDDKGYSDLIERIRHLSDGISYLYILIGDRLDGIENSMTLLEESVKEIDKCYLDKILKIIESRDEKKTL